MSLVGKIMFSNAGGCGRFHGGKMGLISKLFPKKRRQTWVIGDTHFDHSNIIKYCHRPFHDINHMNHVLLKNWTHSIHPSDKVYFLGDLAMLHHYGKWLKSLNGSITIIRGNHDTIGDEHLIIDYHGRKFMLIHNPDYVPHWWDGWVIHGHKHNKNPERYPFINLSKRTVNVSVEMTGYKPVNMDDLIERINHIEHVTSRLNY